MPTRGHKLASTWLAGVLLAVVSSSVVVVGFANDEVTPHPSGLRQMVVPPQSEQQPLIEGAQGDEEAAPLCLASSSEKCSSGEQEMSAQKHVAKARQRIYPLSPPSPPCAGECPNIFKNSVCDSCDPATALGLEGAGCGGCGIVDDEVEKSVLNKLCKAEQCQKNQMACTQSKIAKLRGELGGCEDTASDGCDDGCGGADDNPLDAMRARMRASAGCSSDGLSKEERCAKENQLEREISRLAKSRQALKCLDTKKHVVSALKDIMCRKRAKACQEQRFLSTVACKVKDLIDAQQVKDAMCHQQAFQNKMNKALDTLVCKIKSINTPLNPPNGLANAVASVPDTVKCLCQDPDDDSS